MFGIGFTELLFVLIVALIVLGPDKLPAMAKTLGKAFVEFRRAGEEIKRSINGMNLESHVREALDNRPEPGKKSAGKPAGTRPPAKRRKAAKKPAPVVKSAAAEPAPDDAAAPASTAAAKAPAASTNATSPEEPAGKKVT